MFNQFLLNSIFKPFDHCKAHLVILTAKEQIDQSLVGNSIVLHITGTCTNHTSKIKKRQSAQNTQECMKTQYHSSFRHSGCQIHRCGLLKLRFGSFSGRSSLTIQGISEGFHPHSPEDDKYKALRDRLEKTFHLNELELASLLLHFHSHGCYQW